VIDEKELLEHGYSKEGIDLIAKGLDQASKGEFSDDPPNLEEDELKKDLDFATRRWLSCGQGQIFWASDNLKKDLEDLTQMVNEVRERNNLDPLTH